jgi:hypothetical protein
MNNSDDIIKQRFIKAKLKETADGIKNTSKQRMGSFTSSFWNDRSFTTDDNTMVYTHKPVHRFVDMRTRKKNGVPKRKKSHAIHNRVVMGNYSQLVKELSFGFTEAVKEQFRNIAD